MARALAPATSTGRLGSALSGMRYGSGDPTTRLRPGWFARATLTPEGPGTVVVEWTSGTVRTAGYGPGGDWLVAQVPAMCGALDPGHEFTDAHPVVMAAQRNHPHLRLGASGRVYHELLPTVLGQRITAGEAVRQWHRLVWRLGEPAPGPVAGLRLPPVPERLEEHPAWWFHPLGIEAKRAEALRVVGRHGRRILALDRPDAATAGALLRLLPGVGAWTVGSVLSIALGDPDAFALGDFHLKHQVVHAFTGRARGTDEEMLGLLAPYAGQRGRVVRLLQADGHRPPKFGPRQRVLPMSGW